MTDYQPAPAHHRLTIALTPDAVKALGELEKRSALKKVDLINRSVQVYAWIDEQLRAGATLYVKGSDSDELGQVHIF